MPQFAVHYRNTRRCFYDGVERTPIVTVGVVVMRAPNARKVEAKFRESSSDAYNLSVDVTVQPYDGVSRSALVCCYPEPPARSNNGLGEQIY